MSKDEVIKYERQMLAVLLRRAYIIGVNDSKMMTLEKLMEDI